MPPTLNRLVSRSAVAGWSYWLFAFAGILGISLLIIIVVAIVSSVKKCSRSLSLRRKEHTREKVIRQAEARRRSAATGKANTVPRPDPPVYADVEAVYIRNTKGQRPDIKARLAERFSTK